MPPVAHSSTHPATAWLAHAMPVLVLGAVLLISIALGHRSFVHLVRRRGTAHLSLPPALHLAEDRPPAAFVLSVLVAGAALGLALTMAIGGVWLALVGAPAVMLVVLWAACGVRVRRQVARLDAQLIPALAELSTQIQGNKSLVAIIGDIAATLPAELGREWSFLVQALNRPFTTANGELKVATLADTAEALAAQTRSFRHQTFLVHLANVALKPSTVQVERVKHAYFGMQKSAARERQTQAMLSELRYGGWFIGACIAGTISYVIAQMATQAEQAFSGAIGTIAAIIIGLAAICPALVSTLASRTGDVEY